NTGANAGSPVSIDTLEIYVPTEQRWRRAPDLPIALHGIGGVALQGRQFIAGGSEIANSVVPAGRTFIYQPAAR
ncbi:MAG: kelch repeat-containing protein, partial [Xanthomonadales bacterium]|nr:kelch repeat-containing protein [Xanthomonadales bacterium]